MRLPTQWRLALLTVALSLAVIALALLIRGDWPAAFLVVVCAVVLRNAAAL